MFPHFHHPQLYPPSLRPQRLHGPAAEPHPADPAGRDGPAGVELHPDAHLAPLPPPFPASNAFLTPTTPSGTISCPITRRPRGSAMPTSKRSRAGWRLRWPKMLAVTPEEFQGWSREAQLAFLINAPQRPRRRACPARLPGPLDRRDRRPPDPGAPRHQYPPCSAASGRSNTLVEEIMSYPYQESRAIFLLNWTAKSCAPLPPVAATGQNLKDLLERQTRTLMTDPRYQNYNLKNHILYVSRLLKWYRPRTGTRLRQPLGFREEVSARRPKSSCSSSAPAARASATCASTAP